MNLKYLLLQRMRDVENQVFYFCRSVFTTICFQMRGCKVALVVCYSPLCVFKCFLKALAWAVVKLHWLHLFDFSPLCVFKCVLKALAWAVVKLHWLHLFNFSPVCIFKCLLKSPGREDAFIYLFSSVRFQMCPQIACQRIGLCFQCLFKALEQ